MSGIDGTTKNTQVGLDMVDVQYWQTGGGFEQRDMNRVRKSAGHFPGGGTVLLDLPLETEPPEK